MSALVDAEDEPPAVYSRMSAAIAAATGAARVAFWRLRPRGAFVLEPDPHGFDQRSQPAPARFELGPGAGGVLERIAFSEPPPLEAGTFPGLDRLWREAGLDGVKNSIGASWRAGDRRLGAVIAYDAPNGFDQQAVGLLQAAGMAAGLVTQARSAEAQLGHTAVRLEAAMAARRHLLNNIAAGGDEARRRFASALHDDSLQLLTGAELQLERIRGEAAGERHALHLDQLRNTLRQVEDSLRRLLTNVSPEPLAANISFRVAMSDRLESMRLQGGIETQTDVEVPDELPATVHSIVLKNVAEALTNVEKHASATRVAVSAKAVDGGILVRVKDDGTGFVVGESVRMPGHIGLVALRERTQLAGGWCEIASEPGAGARVEFWVPLSL